MAGPAPRIHLSRASTTVSDDNHGDDHHDGETGAATEEELWAALTPHQLVSLRQHFSHPQSWSGAAPSLAGTEEDTTRHLSRQQFIDVFTALLGSERYVGVCGAIFDAVVANTCPSLASSGAPASHSSSSSNVSSSSSNSSSGGSVGISWAGLVSYLTAGVGGGGRDAPPDPFFSPTPRYRRLKHNKREGVAGVAVCGGGVLVVGARGSLTCLSHRSRQQHHQHSTTLHLDSIPDEEQPSHSLRKVNLGTWVVEVAVLEEDVVVVAASSSTLHLVETASGSAQELLRVTNLSALPSCLAAGCVEERRWVTVGDNKGSVHLLRFPHPASDLLTRSRSEGLTVLTWQEMCGRGQEVKGRAVEACRHVQACSWVGVHGSSVRRVEYHPGSSSLVSCSGDCRTSLVIWDPDHGTKTYTFSISRGVRVFAVEWGLHLLVTGSSDGRLRLWNPYVPEAALATLPPAPGRAPPADVIICRAPPGDVIFCRRPAIITCDADAVVRVYWVEGGQCVQTVVVNFPSGKGGLAPRPLTLLPSGHLLVACRDHLASLTPAPPHRSSSPPPTWHPDIDEGDGERDEDEASCRAKDEDDQLFEDATLMSSDERRRRAEMRRLVRQGAAFCCLKLSPVHAPGLPSGLPLPPRLLTLGLNATDPQALLAHLPLSIINSALKSSSTPASAGLPSPPRVTPTPRPSRPPSATRLGRPKQPGPADPPRTPRTRSHLSPGWRPARDPPV